MTTLKQKLVESQCCWSSIHQKDYSDEAIQFFKEWLQQKQKRQSGLCKKFCYCKTCEKITVDELLEKLKEKKQQ